MEYSALAKIFSLTSLGFLISLLGTPILTHFLLKHRLGKQIRNDGSTPIFSTLHAGKEGTPTMGGILVWGTLTITALFFWGAGELSIPRLSNLNFLTRSETLLPLGAFLGASLVGLLDDWLDIRRRGYLGRGLRFRHKVFLYLAVASVGAWWFYGKLGLSSVYVPFAGPVDFGWWFVPFFIGTTIATSFSVNETDGLDGLAGGTLLIALFSYGLIAYLQGQGNLASFIGVVCGALLAFLWFNVYPARFFMGDTGSMGLGVLLATVAFLTNGVFLLPLIGFVFVVEALSLLLQLAWRKMFSKKLFLSSPLHHHFQAVGWPETKVTMRLWIVAAVTSIAGIIVYFVS